MVKHPCEDAVQSAYDRGRRTAKADTVVLLRKNLQAHNDGSPGYEEALRRFDDIAVHFFGPLDQLGVR